ncbi:MAG TPA: DUF4245 domain-containing protein [Pseudonocardia sp.]|uniref:DUF4245 domain-containing protein n=1 Tax=Pseudonocardia sp. TaxID=60912 RepID=UPI002F407BB0
MVDTGGVSSEAPQSPEEQPAPSERAVPARPRTVLGAGPRDMILSMLVLLPIVGLVALIGRGCSFSPGGVSVDPSSMPTVDVHAIYTEAARRLPFPIREPATPVGWRASSSDQRLAPGGASAVRVGWITDGGRYLRLVQTPAEEGALVVAETGGGPPTANGPVTVGNQQWVDYTGANSEHAWVSHADGVTLLLTGDATPDEFHTLAEAAQRAVPLPHSTEHR